MSSYDTSERSPEVPFATSRGLRLFRLAGIDVQADWSLALIFMLIAFNLGAGIFPRFHPGWRPFTVWATALTAAVLFFASLLAHEFAHAVVARRKGIAVPRISLYMFGGIAHMESEVPTPWAEFTMAIVGPLTSFLIGAVASAVGIQLAGYEFAAALGNARPAAFEQALRATTPLATLLLWLGPVNLLLGVFNLLPGFPMDGGRILRSFLWWVSGDLLKATRWASMAGRMVAYGLMAIGILDVFSGAVVQGFWLLLLGWLLGSAARVSYGELLLRNALSRVTVASLMRTQIDRLTPLLSLEGFVREHAMATDQECFPVEEDGAVLGIISVQQVRRIPESAWRGMPVRDVMVPLERLSTLPPGAEAKRALTQLESGDVELPIVEGDHLLGLVRRSDVLRWLRLHESTLFST